MAVSHRIEPLFQDNQDEQEPEDMNEARPVAPRRAAGARSRRRSSILSYVLTILTALVLVAAAGVAYLLWQQPPEAAAVSPASAPPAVAAAPDANAPAPAATAPKVERIDDWYVVCPVDAGGTAGCYIEQQLLAADTRKVVFLWTIRRDENGAVRSVWHTPPDVVQARGLAIDVGDGAPRGVPFAGCAAGSCTVRATLAPDYVEKLKLAPGITAAVVSGSTGRAVRYGLSGKGLSAALARLAPAP